MQQLDRLANTFSLIFNLIMLCVACAAVAFAVYGMTVTRPQIAEAAQAYRRAGGEATEAGKQAAQRVSDGYQSLIPMAILSLVLGGLSTSAIFGALREKFRKKLPWSSVLRENKLTMVVIAIGVVAILLGVGNLRYRAKLEPVQKPAAVENP